MGGDKTQSANKATKSQSIQKSAEEAAPEGDHVVAMDNKPRGQQTEEEIAN